MFAGETERNSLSQCRVNPPAMFCNIPSISTFGFLQQYLWQEETEGKSEGHFVETNRKTGHRERGKKTLNTIKMRHYKVNATSPLSSLQVQLISI